MPSPQRKTARLRWGRITAAGADYFATLCTQGRVPALTQNTTAIRLLDVLRQMHREGDIRLLATTIMPDHVHLLFTLGERLTYGRAIAKFKTLGRDQGHANWRWQEDGFEHQLRSHENPEDYGFYLYMNPYRAGLIAIHERWQWWWCPEPSMFLFLQGLNADGSPPAAWLGESERVAARIVSGG
ncbi:MAG TPA: transposase [Opitutaceae bacterium]|nr:transposase [Opitutaceae bacterium]